MSSYDKVHELVKEIKESREVKEYLEIKSKVYEDDKNRQLIKDFREKQMEVQSILMQGKEAEAEKMEKLQNLYQILAGNMEIKDFFDKEVRVDVMMSDIYKIIGEAVKDIIE